MVLNYYTFASPLGKLTVMGTESALTHITLDDGASLLSRYKNALPSGSKGFVRQASLAIDNYLAGKTTSIDVAIETEGTLFQRKVWDALLQIPYGTTVSYSEIARRIGAPKAFRAVANACGDNSLPLIIPCHRVVHKSGNVSGFAWGKDAKLFLLNLEKNAAVSLAKVA